MTDHLASQEDQLHLPAAWNAKLLPRRGTYTGKSFEPLDPAVIARHRQKTAARLEKAPAALARSVNAKYAADGAAYLAGEANPRGAAAVAALTVDYDGRSRQSRLCPEFDRWLLEHGPAFAVVAAVERLAIAPASQQGHYGGGAITARTVFEHHVEHPDSAVHELHQGGIAAVRWLLASVSDEVYAEVVAAVAEHRDTPAKRVAAMLLLPTEDAWVLEACTEFRKARAYGSQADEVVWASVGRPEHLWAAGFAAIPNHYPVEAGPVASVLAGLGVQALPILLATYERTDRHDEAFRKILYRAFASIPSDEAVAFVLARLDQPHAWDAATEAAARFPVRTLRAVARLAPDASTDLRGWLAAAANLVDLALYVHVSEADRAVLADLLEGSGRVPDAGPEELPPLLVAPPWTRKRPKAKPVVIAGLEPLAASHLVWTEKEQARWDKVLEIHESDERWNSDKLEGWQFTYTLAYAPPERAERLLERWNGEADADFQHDLLRVLARYGERVIDRVLKLPATDHRFYALPGPILNLAAARIAAERLERLKSARPSAVLWFERHGLAAVPFLVPDALGPDRRLRRYAEFALAHLAAGHGDAAVTEAAAVHGTEAAEAVTALLEADPLIPRVKIPKPGTWASPLVLPQVLLKGGERALPAEAVPHLITVLALGTPENPYPGVAVVAEACERASLARFSRALFERWAQIGAPVKDAWALTQLMHFADDAAVWDLAARISEWPGQGQHQRAITGLKVLGAIGTETALRAIQTIAEKVKFKALKAEADSQITRIADGLGLSRDQLADRLVPDFGLGEQAGLVLDYGPRKFFVAFNEQLQPFVTGQDGKPRKSLPKPGAKDDPELAEEAYRRFAALKKELRSVAADQVRRLETAMVAGRDWSIEEFRRYFAEHALTGHLARRLAEDGTFSDVEDDTVALPETARISLAHPAHLGAATGAWAGLFADYEVLQPFDQLGRPVMAFHDDELATGRLKRFEGTTVDVRRVLGMTQRGWHRAEPGDGGGAPGIWHPLPGGGRVAVTLDPGIWAGVVSEAPEQTVVSVRLARSERDAWEDDAAGIDPVAASEVLASLARLTRTA